MANPVLSHPAGQHPHLTLPHPDWWHGAKIVPLLATLAVGLMLWNVSPPQVAADALPPGADMARAWHLLAIFVSTIVGLIVKPLPMGAVALLGLTVTVLTGTLAIGDALSGFADATIWLIVLAFFIARGFIKTGLGSRIAYLFVALLGKRTLGLGYGLLATDLVLAPATPSNTARAGGVVYPIMRSIATAFGSDPDRGTARKMGTFLTLTAFQGDIITSAMFLTAMAANPLAQKLAGQQGVTITWGGWALAALVPGMLSLLVVPLLIYRLCPPEIETTPDATSMAHTELARMGPIKLDEWVMLGTFGLLLVLWIFGPQLGGLTATAAALVGLGVLLLTGVLTWSDVQQEEGAWNTLVWFAALVMMAGFLNTLGLIPWFSGAVATSLKAAGLTWTAAFAIVALVYFYSHYLFASNTAHVSAMYGAFLAVAIAVGTPPMLAALVLAFFSNLFSSMTHYGAGPAPVLFGSDFVDVGTWWKLGFVVSVVNIAIWLGVGGVWWKVLGIW
jgi:DASS family divalent anion:Na+ symporter